jgi:uncharacterized protein YkwD
LGALAPAAPAAVTGATATADQLSCAGSEVLAATVSPASVEQTVLCLVNGYRRVEGRAPLRLVSSLRVCARGHAQRMVADRFMSHVDPDGTTLADRLREHHYVKPTTRRWSAAENIGIAGGALATARHIVGDWMGSPEHRSNLLRSSLRDIGVGVVAGAPKSIGPGPVTVVIDLASRR